jgi:hypothetical protein
VCSASNMPNTLAHCDRLPLQPFTTDCAMLGEDTSLLELASKASTSAELLSAFIWEVTTLLRMTVACAALAFFGKGQR